MARAVQCPACGQAHPADTLAGTPTFACTGCGRTLRTPTELVRPSGSTPAVRGASGPVPKVTAAKPTRKPTPTPTPTPVAAPNGAATSGSGSGSAPRRARRVGGGKLGLPVRIVAWVVAVGLGLVLTWFVANAIGFLSRSQIVDMFRSSSPTNYIRLFLLIPVWAFMSACLATAFIEGTRLFIARRGGGASTTPGARDERPPRPTIATRVPDAPEVRDVPAADRDPEPARAPLPPGQRTRIRPREPTT
jgi:hypothetical protein